MAKGSDNEDTLIGVYCLGSTANGSVSEPGLNGVIRWVEVENDSSTLCFMGFGLVEVIVENVARLDFGF